MQRLDWSRWGFFEGLWIDAVRAHEAFTNSLCLVQNEAMDLRYWQTCAVVVALAVEPNDVSCHMVGCIEGDLIDLSFEFLNPLVLELIY